MKALTISQQNLMLSNNQTFEMISWSLHFENRLIFTYLLKTFRFPNKFTDQNIKLFLLLLNPLFN